MKQETKRRIEISNLHEFADSLILIDNRIERCKKHQASTIVLIAISAVICGADTWNSIEDFGKSKESFFAARDQCHSRCPLSKWPVVSRCIARFECEFSLVR